MSASNFRWQRRAQFYEVNKSPARTIFANGVSLFCRFGAAFRVRWVLSCGKVPVRGTVSVSERHKRRLQGRKVFVPFSVWKPGAGGNAVPLLKLLRCCNLVPSERLPRSPPSAQHHYAPRISTALKGGDSIAGGNAVSSVKYHFYRPIILHFLRATV